MAEALPAADLSGSQDQLAPVLKAIGELFKDVIRPRVLKEQWQHAIDAAEINKMICLVSTTCRGLKLRDDQSFATVTKALADGSRNEPWRGPLGILALDFYLGLLAEGGDHSWTIDALRLIGNCCIDMDANRERTLKSLDMDQLLGRIEGSGPQADVALGVLYNLCLDYEPAQQAARAHGLYLSVLQLFRKGDYSSTSQLSQTCTLLDFAVEEMDLASSPEDAIKTIYHVLATAEPEFDESLSLCNAILAILTSERYQKLTIARDEVHLITTLFIFSYTLDTSILKTPEFTSPLPFDTKSEEPDQEEALSQLRSTLTARLWDLSAHTEFIQAPFIPDLVRMLREWLSSPWTQMQLCACSMFRNIATSHSVIADMIRDTHIHESLLSVMKHSIDVQLLEEALRLYRNLAIHPDYRTLLAAGEAFETITALWSKFPVQNVQYAASRLVRQLLTGETEDVERFLTSKPQSSEALPASESYIARLFQLYSTTNDLATRMEVGQIIVAIWRTMAQQHSTTESDFISSDTAIHQAREADFNIAKPVMNLITSSNNPSLKTQGWLGLALMAGSQEGSLTVAEIIDDDAGENMAIFQRTLLEKGVDGVPTKDANNACILLTLLKKNHPKPPPQIARLENPGGLSQKVSQQMENGG